MSDDDQTRYERGRAKLLEVHGEKSLRTIESLGDLGRSSQLPVHLRSSLKAGLTPDELREIIIQTATLAGFPAAMNAFSTLKTILSEGDPSGG